MFYDLFGIHKVNMRAGYLSRWAQAVGPWIGLGLGLGAAIGLIGVFATAIVHAVLVGPDGGSALYYEIIGFVEGVVVNLGVVGIAVSLASLLAGFRPRPVAVVGLLGGAAALALEFGLLWLSAA